VDHSQELSSGCRSQFCPFRDLNCSLFSFGVRAVPPTSAFAGVVHFDFNVAYDLLHRLELASRTLSGLIHDSR